MALGVPFQKLSTELSTITRSKCITFILLVDKSTISVDKSIVIHMHLGRAESHDMKRYFALVLLYHNKIYSCLVIATDLIFHQ